MLNFGTIGSGWICEEYIIHRPLAAFRRVLPE